MAMGCSDASPEEVLTHENAVLARVLQSSEDVVELAREHLTSRTSAPISVLMTIGGHPPPFRG